MPNYGSPVIPEIRFDAEDSTRTGGGTNAFANNGNKVFTVSATMHTHAQHGAVGSVHEEDDSANDRLDADVPNHPKLDFQAPFQASVNADSSVPQNQGWAVIVRDKNKTTEVPEVTTMPYATTSEFDIENFKPQLEGGFKPIYNLPADDKTSPRVEVSEREE
ncbi:hypothetical protein JTB14_016797 [Gonioctena quinquepunctata]|nr:hypothetical protein JTB14_016797 [Gonioctena quinquepunctata]